MRLSEPVNEAAKMDKVAHTDDLIVQLQFLYVGSRAAGDHKGEVNHYIIHCQLEGGG